MARSAWVLLVTALVAAGALVWWRAASPPAAPGPVATAAIAPPKADDAPRQKPADAAPPKVADAPPAKPDDGVQPKATDVAPPAGGDAVLPKAGGHASPADAAALQPEGGTAGEAKPDAPSFDVVRVAPSGGAVIAGRAAPGVEVTIKDGASEVGRAVADQRGEWVVLPNDALAPGTHALVVEAPSGARSDDVAVLVPEKAGKDQPGTKTEQALAVLLPKDAPARPLQGSPAAPPGVLALDAVEYDSKGEVVVGGQAKPGAEIHIYLGGAPLGTATADETGRWTTKPARAIDPGLYTLRADEVAPGGRIVARVSVPFRRAVVTSGGPGDQIVVQPGDNLWNIARQTYGAGPRYAVIYAANQTDIRDPDLIYPGQVFRLPAN
jgi:nucleoid-associated protein YgaU